MTITATGAAPAAPPRTGRDVAGLPWRPFRVVVARTDRLSPSFIRVTFTGDDVDQFGHDGPDQRVKLFIPRAGADLAVMSPAEWYAQYRASKFAGQGVVRTYTIRAVRPHLRELDIDFVLHGEPGRTTSGPAAAWAAAAEPGDELVAIGPNRAYPGECRGHEWNPPIGVRDVLVAGDETAVPAIAGILADLKRACADARVQVFIEVPEPTDVLDLPTPENAEITWLPRQRSNGTALPHGQRLVEAVRSVAFGERAAASRDISMVDTVDIDLEVLWEVAASASSPAYAWVAGEAGAVKAIRRHLVRERGLDKCAVTFMGYWRLGRSLDES